MNFIGAIFFYLLVFLVGLLPFFILYLLSDFVAFLLRYVARYRKEIMYDNLKGTFPQMSSNDLDRLVGRVYRNLSDILLEGVKAFTITRCQVNRRHVIRNAHLLDPYHAQGRSVIVVTGHYGNWEWGAFSPSLQTPYMVVGFYKPLRNKWIDRHVRWSRSRFGTVLASIYDTSKTFDENEGRPFLYLMAADQNPRNKEKAYQANFLGRNSYFLHGPEKHARLHHCVVMYVDIRRVKRGYYEMDLSVLAEHPDELPDGEITQRFAAKLESVIREEPANWLWSHKRWKSDD